MAVGRDSSSCPSDLPSTNAPKSKNSPSTSSLPCIRSSSSSIGHGRSRHEGHAHRRRHLSRRKSVPSLYRLAALPPRADPRNDGRTCQTYSSRSLSTSRSSLMSAWPLRQPRPRQVRRPKPRQRRDPPSRRPLCRNPTPGQANLPNQHRSQRQRTRPTSRARSGGWVCWACRSEKQETSSLTASRRLV